ncbi:MAG: hypothetical protein HQL90_01980 [Magnetococcales bacterium]|nr:hypothetical protein [Magnetococcales bacterium]
MKQYLKIVAISAGILFLAGCRVDSSVHREEVERGRHKHHGSRSDVAQCIRDNADARVRPSVVRRYCICMDEKMSVHDRRSITEWERHHPRAVAECERISGWR